MARKNFAIVIVLILVAGLLVSFGGQFLAISGPANSIKVFSSEDASLLGADNGWPLQQSFSPSYDSTLAQVTMLIRWTVRSDVKQSWILNAVIECEGQVKATASNTFSAYVGDPTWYGLPVTSPETSKIMFAGRPCVLTVDIGGGTGAKADIYWLIGSNSMKETIIWGYPPLLPKPTADFQYSVTNLTVKFDGTASGGTPPYTYSWDLGGGSPSSATTQTATSTYTISPGVASMTVSVSLTVEDVNRQTNTREKSFVLNAPTPPPAKPLVVSFTWSSSTTVQRTVTFVSSVSGGTPPYVYSWDFGDGSIAGYGASTSHSYATSGNFTVVLRVTDSADASVSISDIVTTGKSGGTAPPASTNPECSDGTDNDADGLIDFPADPGCSSDNDDDETGDAAPLPLLYIILGIAAIVIVGLFLVRRRLF